MKKSAIITFLSLKNERNERKDYMPEEGGDVVSGIQTNDAPVKYLFRKSEECENAADKIVCIVSQKVYGENGADSTYRYFQNMVKEEIKCDVEVVLIPYDFQIAASGTITEVASQPGKAMSVYQGISKMLAGYDEVYIDYTGGFRDTGLLMTVLIRYLEFTDAICKDIVYSNLQEGKIYSLKYIYDMFKLLNAVSQFVETGNGKQLKEIYDLDSIRHEPTKNLVKCIYKFSNVMCLCRVEEVDKVVNAMAEAIIALENEYSGMEDAGVEPTDVNDIQVRMFRNLLQVIKKKFYIEGERVSFTYPKLIKWCIDNELWQQAMTLYVEKMPIFYETEGLVKKPSEESINKLFPERKQGAGETKAVYHFYTVLFEEIRRAAPIYKTIEVFQDKIKEVQELYPHAKSVKNVKRNCTDEIRKALERVELKLRRFHNESRWVCGVQIRAKNQEDFLRELLNNQILAYAFICDTTEKSKVEEFKKIKYNLYRKKVAALKNLRGMEDVSLYTAVLSKDQLFSIMLYYLAIKYMRNQVHHAVERGEELADKGKKEKDEKYLGKYLKENGVETDIEVENVRKVLSDGLRFTNEELFLTSDSSCGSSR